MLLSACVVAMLAVLPVAALAAAPTPAKGQWVNISKKWVDDAMEEFGAIPNVTSGVAVDPTNGDVYMVMGGRGIWKSVDQGAKFKRVDNEKVGGIGVTTWSLNVDPAGKRLACFMLDGPCAMLLDSGKTAAPFATVHRNWDFGVVDWTDPQAQSMVTLWHESGGQGYYSPVGGKDWTIMSEKGMETLGIFDAKTIVAGKAKGIIRSTDSGQKWQKVSDFTPVAGALLVTGGVGYWLAKEGILVSKDKGVTWTVQGQPVAAVAGPYFGSDPKQIIAAGEKGFYESKDAGVTWQNILPLPSGYKMDGALNAAWDPLHDTFYVSRLGQHTMKYQR